MTKNTKVISAYPACGKSYFKENVQDFFESEEDITVLDSDSSQFSWIYENGEKTDKRNPDFPKNYIKHIKDNIGKVDIIFVSSHSIVRRELAKNNIKFTLVVPKKNCLNEWMIRYINRGDSNEFIDNQIDNWDKWLNEITQEKDTYSKLIQLEQRQYIADIIHKC
mgnify:CR=1 FL=1